MRETITLEIADTMSPSEVVAVVLKTAVTAFGGAGGMVAIASDSGEGLEIIGQLGFPETVVEPHRHLPFHPPTPATAAYRSRAPEFVETLAEFKDRYPELARATTGITGTRALLCIPLFLEERAIGVFGVTYREDHLFSTEERASAVAFAARAAQAIGHGLKRQGPSTR